MKLLHGNLLESRKATTLTLDEVYRMAQQHGKVELGGILGEEAAEIKLTHVGEHYIVARCRRYPDVVSNLAECIKAAEMFREALKREQQ